MKIVRCHFVAGYSSFYFDDQQAIKAGAIQDGFVYRGDVCTPGFQSIRQAGECVSVLLELDNGSVAVGDCAAVQYSGAGGRDPLFVTRCSCRSWSSTFALCSKDAACSGSWKTHGGSMRWRSKAVGCTPLRDMA